MMYKITFDLDSSIFFTERINFDGLVAWAYVKHTQGENVHPLFFKTEIDIDFEGLIPIKHENSIPVASSMYFDEAEMFEWVDYWRKRWNSRLEYYVDMKKGGEVRNDRGDFKSYEIPMDLKLIRQVWFYFDTDDLDFVKELLKHVQGLGKKRNRGKGKIKNCQIEKIEMDFFDEVRRPLPIRLVDLNKYKNKAGEIRMMRYKSPYWSMLNAEPCLIPSYTNNLFEKYYDSFNDYSNTIKRMNNTI